MIRTRGGNRKVRLLSYNYANLSSPKKKTTEKVEIQDIIEKGGFKLLTSLGHGLGLSEHDSPTISRKPIDPISLKNWKEIVVKEGMVFTIEPGVYVKGVGGCRFENDVLMARRGPQMLTHSRLVKIG